MLSKLLARQLRRALQLDHGDPLQDATRQLLDPSSPQHAMLARRLIASLPHLVGDIDDSYRQYERDLDLRSRSLELSSEELVAANERLRQEAIEQQHAIRQLRATTNQLLHNNHMPLLQEDGHDLLSITNLISVLVSQREEVRRELQANEARLRNLIANLPGCIYRLSHDGIWSAQILSGSVYELTGYEPGEFLSGQRSFNAIVAPDDLPRRNQAILHACRNGTPFALEYRIHCRDGRVRWVVDRGQGIYADDGALLSIDGVILDNTTQHEAQEAQRLAREAAEAANEAKSRFLANVSHEIRTPLNGILGMTELVLGGELPDAEREALGLVKNSADSLLVIINDLLDFSRIEHGQFAIEHLDFSLQDLLKQTLAPLAIKATGKGLQLHSSIDTRLPATFSSDPMRLRQILVNLVGNAIKFTPHGRIDINIHRTDEGRIRFSIRDTGIGIEPERQQAIFDPFTQADISTTRLYGGTGLGLSISSQLVTRLGGKLCVESQPGQGSHFHFDLPLATESINTSRPIQQLPDTNLPHHQAERAQTGSLNILLAEDNPINQKVAVHFLALGGHRVVTAHNGHEVEKCLAQETFDLVLMDIQMPLMDGLQCTHRIRASETSQSRHMPIIALTAHASASERDNCLANGMDGFISKPFSRHALLAEINRVMSQAATPDISSNTPIPGSNLYDRDQALDMLGGDCELLRELSEVFLRETQSTMQQIGRAQTDRDAQGLSRAAHTLKSSLGAVGALRVMATAQALENQAAIAAWSDIPTLANRLNQEYLALCELLREN